MRSGSVQICTTLNFVSFWPWKGKQELNGFLAIEDVSLRYFPFFGHYVHPIVIMHVVSYYENSKGLQLSKLSNMTYNYDLQYKFALWMVRPTGIELMSYYNHG